MKMTYKNVIFKKRVDSENISYEVIHKPSTLNLGHIVYGAQLHPPQPYLIPSHGVIITFEQLKQICQFISEIQKWKHI